MSTSATTTVIVPGQTLTFGDVTAWVVEDGGTLVLLAEESDGFERCVARISDWSRVVVDRD